MTLPGGCRLVDATCKEVSMMCSEPTPTMRGTFQPEQAEEATVQPDKAPESGLAGHEALRKGFPSLVLLAAGFFEGDLINNAIQGVGSIGGHS
jgi:hypothetical protein